MEELYYRALRIAALKVADVLYYVGDRGQAESSFHMARLWRLNEYINARRRRQSQARINRRTPLF